MKRQVSRICSVNSRGTRPRLSKIISCGKGRLSTSQSVAAIAARLRQKVSPATASPGAEIPIEKAPNRKLANSICGSRLTLNRMVSTPTSKKPKGSAIQRHQRQNETRSSQQVSAAVSASVSAWPHAGSVKASTISSSQSRNLRSGSTCSQRLW